MVLARIRGASAVGVCLCALAWSPLIPGASAENRTIDGGGNNPADADIGRAGTMLSRMVLSDYGDGVSTPAGGDRPDPRAISNGVFNQAASSPDPRGLSAFVWAWGQFLDHDIDLTPAHEPAEAFDIDVTGDLMFDPQGQGAVLELDRSMYAPSSAPRQQLNMITAWIDGSNVYGSDTARAGALRSGSGGRLATSTGNFLPCNTLGFENAQLPFQDDQDMFLAGDIRANENVALTAMHTVFMREHNRIATEAALANPGWDDGQLYEWARKIVGAEMQAITYGQFLPAFGVEIAPYDGYQSQVDGTILNEFSTAAYRVGHSMVTPMLMRIDETGAPIPAGHLSLMEAFFAPDRFAESGVEPIMLGLLAQTEQAIEAQVVDELRHFMFGPPGSPGGGLDLVSLNIQRGRDHGLASYASLRQELGLGTVDGFDDIMSDTEVQANLATVYGTVDKVDPWVGMLAEDIVPGASIGATLKHILEVQFTALRDGDRFYFENDSALSAAIVADLRATRLSDVIMRNTTIDVMTDNIFFSSAVPEPGTAAMLCVLAPFLWRSGPRSRSRQTSD
ncbi:MAG: peroxiredoxin [Phycisphaeraceae bacterium]|nr:peroxiredoxin [Phycisphaeraceae bacterium]